MITPLVCIVVLSLCAAVVVAVAHDRGPDAPELARAYELAWDRLDFTTLWALSGDELRDGRDRDEFVTAKRAAYVNRSDLGGIVAQVAVEDVSCVHDAAVVATRVELRDGTVVRNGLQLARRAGQWRVTAYDLLPVA